MSLVKWAFIGLIVLPAAELAVLLLAVALLGWLPAVALFVATSVVGILILKRRGRGDLDRLRAALARDGIRAMHLDTPGLAPAIAGILLVFPGFITDILGAAMLVPALRRWAAARFRQARGERRRRQRDQRVIDLEPGEWRPLSEPRRERRRKSKGASKGM